MKWTLCLRIPRKCSHRVVTNQWTAEQLGTYYKSVASPLGPVIADIMEYRSSATEY
ncbi:unnamed protein product [Penicillium roqueforti FM164]|uniref:Genomic scaffold, ProqFM164S01 n=1 Tax=Penicillium roqueforti (strain FM164) TaxID=1365484 RepID=W6Q606_PENRF|nr:unnamed protein product [Penicillium roqueforti FM164]